MPTKTRAGLANARFSQRALRNAVDDLIAPLAGPLGVARLGQPLPHDRASLAARAVLAAFLLGLDGHAHCIFAMRHVLPISRGSRSAERDRLRLQDDLALIRREDLAGDR